MAVTTASLLFTGTTTATTIALGGTLAWGQVVIGGLVFSAATSLVTNALMPKPDFGGMGSNGTQTNFKSTTAPHDIVYGRTRKGGVVTYMETTDTNKYLHMIVVLAGHECDAVESIYINDKVATIDGNGLVTSYIEEDGSGDDKTWASKIRIFAHTGAQTLSTVFSNIGGSTNTSNKTLVNTLHTETENSGMTNAFIGSGLTYLYVRLEYDGEVFSGGIPTFTAKLKGKKVYDPREAGQTSGNASSWDWSANAALCVRDYLTSDYGVNSPTSEIDDASIISAANACATVSVGSDPNNPFDINGVVQTSSTPQSILNQMMTACGGTLFWGQGAWKLMIGYQTPRTTALTLGDLRGPISLDTRMSRRDAFNIIQGQFADAAQDYITVDYPQYRDASSITEDNSQESILDLSLPLTTSSATAQRLAKQTLLRNREQMTFSASFGIKAFDIQAGDIVKLTLARYGWTDKLFEVVSWSFGVGETTVVNLTLRETSQAAFSWVENDYSIITANNTTLPSPFEVGVPVMQNPTQLTQQNYDGFATSKIIFTWTAATTGAVSYNYDFAWKLSTDSTYTITRVSGLKYELIGVQKGLIYNYKVRAVNNLGIASAYDIYSSGAFTVTTYDSVPPSAPTDVTATGMYQAIKLSWTLPTTNQGTGTELRDLSHFNIHRYTGSTGSPASSAKIAEIRGTEFIDSNLGNLATRYYYLTSEDLSGNKSYFTGNSGTTNSSTTLSKPDVTSGQSPIPYGFQVEYAGDPTTVSNGVQSSLNAATVTAVAAYSSGFTNTNLLEMPDDGIYVMKFISNNTNDSEGNPKVSIRVFTPVNNQWTGHATVTPNDIAIDGSIIATGSITSNEISANYARLIEIDADQITTGKITAQQLEIADNLAFLDGGAYYSGMTAFNDGSGIYVGNPSGATHDYAFAFSTGSGSSRKAINMNASEFSLYNPTIYTGASTAYLNNAGSGTMAIPTDATQMTVTLIGGGGGGGGSQSDMSNNSYNPAVGANGSATTASFTATGVNGGSLVSLSAAGGAGGANGSNIASGGVGAGGSTSYGAGGAVGASQSTGASAAATAYGAGGGGGGSRPYGGWLNSGQDATTQGQGGLAGTSLSNTYDLSLAGGFNVTVAAGAAGIYSSSFGNGNVSNGGSGAVGRVYISYTTVGAEIVDLVELTEAKVALLKAGTLPSAYTNYGNGSAGLGRNNATWYQNTTGGPIYVNICSTGGGHDVYLNTSASTSGALRMIAFGNGTGHYEQAAVGFVVPNNYYYYGGRHSNGDSAWVELR